MADFNLLGGGVDPQSMQQNMDRQFALGQRQQAKNLRTNINQAVQDNPQLDLGSSADFNTYSSLDPDGANKMLNTFSGLSKTRQQRYIKTQLNAKVALELGDKEGALNYLDQHIKKVIDDGGDPRNSEYVRNLINSDQTDEALAGFQQMEEGLVQQGLLNEDKSFADKRQATKTAMDQRQLQSAKYMDGGTLVTFRDGTQEFKEYDNKMVQAIKRYRRKFKPKLTAGQIGEIIDTQNAAADSRGLASTAQRISNQFAKKDPMAGLPAKGTELWKKIWGTEDEISSLRKDYTKVKNEFLVNGLPPGIASDKDVALINAGYLESTANAGQLSEFMASLARVQQDAAMYNEFRAAFLERSGGVQVADRPFNYRGVDVGEGQSIEDAYSTYISQQYPQKFAQWQAKRNGGSGQLSDPLGIR